MTFYGPSRGIAELLLLTTLETVEPSLIILADMETDDELRRAGFSESDRYGISRLPTVGIDPFANRIFNGYLDAIAERADDPINKGKRTEMWKRALERIDDCV